MSRNMGTKKKADDYEQTEWEKQHDRVSRKELRKNILGFFDEMEDSTFHRWYHDLWCWSADHLLLQLAKSSEARQKREIESLKERIEELEAERAEVE